LRFFLLDSEYEPDPKPGNLCFHIT
jgi:hypothetical protein